MRDNQNVVLSGDTLTGDYAVKYYDEKLSRQGKGIQYQRFTTREGAAVFAEGRICYGKPAQVLVVVKREIYGKLVEIAVAEK